MSVPMRNRIYFDMEMTGLHQFTSPISLAMVSETRQQFYAEFTDYDRNQVTPWVQDNVISKLTLTPPLTDELPLMTGHIFDSFTISGTRYQIGRAVFEWLENIAARQRTKVQLIGDVLAYDWMLFCELFPIETDSAERLPAFVDYIPLDLATLLFSKGVDPDISRENFAGDLVQRPRKHNALFDALIIKSCYEKAKQL